VEPPFIGKNIGYFEFYFLEETELYDLKGEKKTKFY
jgi:hypothetical protein